MHIVETMTPDLLFHGTSAAAAAGIVYENSFMAENTHGDEKGLGVSLTRDLRIAKRFADESSHAARINGSADWMPGYAEALVNGTGGLVLVLERKSLAGMLVPIESDADDFGYEIEGQPVNDESEERLIAAPGLNHVSNARALISSIILINPRQFARFCSKLQRLAPEYADAIQFLKGRIS